MLKLLTLFAITAVSSHTYAVSAKQIRFSIGDSTIEYGVSGGRCSISFEIDGRRGSYFPESGRCKSGVLKRVQVVERFQFSNYEETDLFCGLNDLRAVIGRWKSGSKVGRFVWCIENSRGDFEGFFWQGVQEVSQDGTWNGTITPL